MQKIKKGFSGLTDEKLSAQTGYVLTKMTGNTNFPTPVPSLTEILNVKKDFDIAVSAVRAGNRTAYQVTLKNKFETLLKRQLDQLFNYVNTTGAGNIEVLTSSGFPLAKERQPIGELPQPQDFTMRSFQSGSASLKCKRVHGADCYNYQYTLAPNPEVENWITITDTRSFIKIENLQPGAQYKFRMCAVGADGAGPWSQAINCFINF